MLMLSQSMFVPAMGVANSSGPNLGHATGTRSANVLRVEHAAVEVRRWRPSLSSATLGVDTEEWKYFRILTYFGERMSTLFLLDRTGACACQFVLAYAVHS